MSLLPFQEDHCLALIAALQAHNVSIDSSDTGTGKTYVACEIARRLGLQPIIICPKSVMSNWNRVLKLFNVTALGISNYESIREGNWFGGIGREKCSYYDPEEHIWSGLPSNAFFIFDEVHICKNKKTQNSKVLMACHYDKTACPCLMLSATVADKTEYYSVVAYMLGFCKSENLFDMQLRRYRKSNPGVSDSMILQKYTFPEYGSRMNLGQIVNMPDNIILPETYDLDETKMLVIRENYELLNDIKDERKTQKKEAGNRLTKILRARQHIELVKVGLMTDMAKEYLAEGKSVVIFVNFRDTMEILIAELNIKCSIHGQQTSKERDHNIDTFQSNKERIMICMIQSGSVGVSLHDTDGNFPRVSIISPPWSAQNLMQALGRVHRAGSKSKAIQKILYCSGCIEEKIQQILERKIKVYHDFNQ